MRIDLVAPCYNEEDVLNEFIKTIDRLFASLENYSCRLILVDDGSSDSTLDIIKASEKKHPWIDYIALSRNFGKESAMYAGLEAADADYVGVLDADLQHPPRLILQMVEALEEGYQVCATRRVDRLASKTYNRGASIFYKILNYFGENIYLEDGVQDFRLMKREVVDGVLSLQEKSRFSKGIFSWVGFDIKYIDVGDVPRPAGESKWSFLSSVKYAFDGIFSFSTAPLKISILLGTLFSLVGFVYLFYLIIKTLVQGADYPGFATTVGLILLIGGVNLIFMGIVGLYIGRIYQEVKDRPIYLSKDSSLTEKDK